MSRGETIPLMERVHRFEFTVPPEAADGNRHVNNVAYVRWMQEAAIRHADECGCTKLTHEAGASWVVRTHRIEYFRTAFPGEVLVVETWVENFRKVRSLRRYRFTRTADQAVVAEGETDWVYVDAESGRPRPIPPAMEAMFRG